MFRLVLVRLPGHSVLSHFSSLDVATDLLNAAFLDLHTAMRPYESLSGGEQAMGTVVNGLKTIDSGWHIPIKRLR